MNTGLVIDYDRLEAWAPHFAAIVIEVTGPEVIRAAKRSSPRYIEDARRFFEEQIGVQRLVEGLSERLRPWFVRVYHGTRLNEDELASVRRLGLRPLTLAEREPLLAQLFEAHPDWSRVRDKLADSIRRHGVDWATSGVGKREDGGIHVCLSRAGLLHGCNHYLTHGAEVDQFIASELFDNERSREFLRTGRAPKLISFTAPFEEAAAAANPWGVRRDEMPSLLRSLFQAWAFSLNHPSFDVAKERDGVALRFPSPISPDRITIEDVSDDQLTVRP
jgi:hypothetical protein